MASAPVIVEVAAVLAALGATAQWWSPLVVVVVGSESESGHSEDLNGVGEPSGGRSGINSLFLLQLNRADNRIRPPCPEPARLLFLTLSKPDHGYFIFYAVFKPVDVCVRVSQINFLLPSACDRVLAS
ncbi:cytochrome b5 domain-containing protein 1 [Platysternon megacephalum]|uniref:Cytochrome b5 domain-containing protein 1 n=1 Tax=Platysternon megacephalum TaxID=55544 RepID=A0A4D9DLC0_9SAUR|nr:cytochrome b5 domain-containing protein 1 [Platysternon megacephalum]